MSRIIDALTHSLHENENVVLVLVTDQFECERIIKSAKLMADKHSAGLSVLNIQKNKRDTNPQAIDHLFNISRQNSAQMTMLYSDDIFRTIIQHLKRQKPVSVLTGMPRGENSVLYRIWERLPGLKYYIVDYSGNIHQVSHNLECDGDSVFAQASLNAAES